MGGTLYIRNLISTLEQLPEQRRPVIYLLDENPASYPQIRELSRCSIVRNRYLFGRYTLYLNKLTGRMFPWTRNYQNRVDIIYPVLNPHNHYSAKQIYWIPDFQHEYMPELFSPQEVDRRRLRDRAAAESGGFLVLSSKTAEADFRKFHPHAAVRIFVWSFVSNISSSEITGDDPRSKYRLPEKYLYLPNQFWVHKNHEVVFSALGILKKKNMNINLVCTGNEVDARNAGHINRLRQQISDLGLTHSIHFLGLLPRFEQIQIFRHAAAVIQPSLFEGWSTVVEDAKSLGRPLFLSDIPVHREQQPEPAVYFDPASPEELAHKLESSWMNLVPGPDVQAEGQARTRREAETLDCAEAFMHILESCVKKN